MKYFCDWCGWFIEDCVCRKYRRTPDADLTDLLFATRRARAWALIEEPVVEPQETARACLRCEHPALNDHHAGGCRRCDCVSPFGGLT